jgi:hypothetical protein
MVASKQEKLNDEPIETEKKSLLKESILSMRNKIKDQQDKE